jgi:hypothetical protein
MPPLWLTLLALVGAASLSLLALISLLALCWHLIPDARPYDTDDYEPSTDPVLAADPTRGGAVAAAQDADRLPLRLGIPRLAPACAYCGADHTTRECPHQGMRGAA